MSVSVKSLFLAAAVATAPHVAGAQGTGAKNADDNLFSWKNRPSVQMRDDSLDAPRTRQARQKETPHNPDARKRNNADVEFGVEGYVWVGMSLKL